LASARKTRILFAEEVNMKKQGFWILFCCLLMALPTLVQADSSLHFPNDKDGNTHNVANGTAGVMQIRANFTHTANVSTPPLPLPPAPGPGQTGQKVSTEAATALCNAAVSVGYVCTPHCVFPDSSYHAATCDWQLTGKGFDMWRYGGAINYKLAPFGLNSIASHRGKNTAGSTIGVDILPMYMVRVNPYFDPGFPGGVHGDVDFGVYLGDPNIATVPDYSFYVNTAAYGTDDEALHQAIAAGFVGMGLGLDTYVDCAPGDQHYILPNLGDFDGCYVRIANVEAAGVTMVTAGGVQEMFIVAQTGTGEWSSIPTLSSWGIALLSLILVLTAVWLLRRRQHLPRGVANE
jgi:hypothetical protein